MDLGLYEDPSHHPSHGFEGSLSQTNQETDSSARVQVTRMPRCEKSVSDPIGRSLHNDHSGRIGDMLCDIVMQGMYILVSELLFSLCTHIYVETIWDRYLVADFPGCSEYIVE